MSTGEDVPVVPVVPTVPPVVGDGEGMVPELPSLAVVPPPPPPVPSLPPPPHGVLGHDGNGESNDVLEAELQECEITLATLPEDRMFRYAKHKDRRTLSSAPDSMWFNQMVRHYRRIAGADVDKTLVFCRNCSVLDGSLKGRFPALKRSLRTARFSRRCRGMVGFQCTRCECRGFRVWDDERDDFVANLTVRRKRRQEEADATGSILGKRRSTRSDRGPPPKRVRHQDYNTAKKVLSAFADPTLFSSLPDGVARGLADHLGVDVPSESTSREVGEMVAPHYDSFRTRVFGPDRLPPPPPPPLD